MTVFYNEPDPYAAQWLRNLIAAGHVAPGVVDERLIQEIEPFELSGFTQCHFFAGIGVWSYALRNAGWPDDQPIWTGSCPCQPFSAAGKQKGFFDDRHLWPYWKNLIDVCKPAIVVGEQVASALEWLDLVSAEMEATGYTFGASDLCAAGFGGAHIRQRLYFVGLADGNQHGCDQTGERGTTAGRNGLVGNGALVGLEHDASNGRQQRWTEPSERGLVDGRGNVGLVNTNCARTEARLPEPQERDGWNTKVNDHGSHRLFGSQKGRSSLQYLGNIDRPNAPMLGRNAADWLFCRDGKWRPVEPGTFPLAYASPARVGRLRAYGNALDAETASNFLAAVADIAGIRPLTLEFDL